MLTTLNSGRKIIQPLIDVYDNNCSEFITLYQTKVMYEGAISFIVNTTTFTWVQVGFGVFMTIFGLISGEMCVCMMDKFARKNSGDYENNYSLAKN